MNLASQGANLNSASPDAPGVTPTQVTSVGVQALVEHVEGMGKGLEPSGKTPQDAGTRLTEQELDALDDCIYLAYCYADQGDMDAIRVAREAMKRLRAASQAEGSK